jgi:transcriptional regulator with XRE-family HTH domain
MATKITDAPSLGEGIRWARERRGMTLRALAKACDLSPPFLSDLEHNRRTTNKLARIATVLEVSLEDLQQLDGRVPEDLRDWLMKHPKVIGLLRDIKDRKCSPLILKRVGL